MFILYLAFLMFFLNKNSNPAFFISLK